MSADAGHCAYPQLHATAEGNQTQVRSMSQPPLMPSKPGVSCSTTKWVSEVRAAARQRLPPSSEAEATQAPEALLSSRDARVSQAACTSSGPSPLGQARSPRGSSADGAGSSPRKQLADQVASQQQHKQQGRARGAGRPHGMSGPQWTVSEALYVYTRRLSQTYRSLSPVIHTRSLLSPTVFAAQREGIRKERMNRVPNRCG